MGSRTANALRLCAVSVDLDEVGCYRAIHGLPELPFPASHAVYRRALPRLLELFENLSIPATLFACGRDLGDSVAAQTLRSAARSGYEIGNHSQDHVYDFSRRSRDEIHAQVLEGMKSIEHATGEVPVGFRAPGYTINDTVFDVLQELGVTYDSSVFPCPPYYAAKSLAIGQYRLRGRPTRSIVDDPRVLTAPAEPYRVGRPYYRRGSGILELPIGVTRDITGRLPYIGTYVVAAGDTGARVLTRLMQGRSLVNLELHGLDAADADADQLQQLVVPQQPDMRLTAKQKLQSLRAALTLLRERGYEFVTLRDAAKIFGAIR